MNYYIGALKKYAVFEGRSRRSEFWYFCLFNFIISFILGIISGIVGDNQGILGTIYFLAILIPALAVSARRLHDIGKSGWWILINLIPVVGFIWYIVLIVKDSAPGENKYGFNPKMVPAAVSPVSPQAGQQVNS